MAAMYMQVYNETHWRSGIISMWPDNSRIYAAANLPPHVVAARLDANMSVGDIAMYIPGRGTQYTVVPKTTRETFFYKPAESVIVAVAVLQGVRIMRWVYARMLTAEKMDEYSAAIAALV